MKTCSKCGVSKEGAEFHKKRASKDGLRTYCKGCSKKKGAAYYQANFEQVTVVNRKWRAKNYKRVKEGAQKRDLNRKYSITPEAWNELFENQGGVCAICKNPETQNKRISVDHDHETGKVRGLLCNNCNRGLGLLKDSLHTLLSAVEYLRKAKLLG